MEDNLTWLMALLIFMGIIAQHDAHAAAPLTESAIEIEQLPQSVPETPFLELAKRLNACKQMSVPESGRSAWQSCLSDEILLCANGPKIGLEGPSLACVPGSDQRANRSRTGTRPDTLAG